MQDEISLLQQKLNEASVPTQSDHLEALSKKLLDEKNAEIDELRRQMALLQDDDQLTDVQEVSNE